MFNLIVHMLVVMVIIILSPMLYFKRFEYYKIKQFGIDAHNRVNHRYGGKPYSVHLKMVHKYAHRYIYGLMGDLPKKILDAILAACWVHDVIEDCRLTYTDVKEYCGSMVADIVYALSNEKGKFRKDRANDKYYDGIRATRYASFIKICDRMANIEYSKKNGSSMFEKYKSEHSEFRKKLYDVRYAIMFEDMEKMLGLKDKFGNTI